MNTNYNILCESVLLNEINVKKGQEAIIRILGKNKKTTMHTIKNASKPRTIAGLKHINRADVIYKTTGDSVQKYKDASAALSKNFEKSRVNTAKNLRAKRLSSGWNNVIQ